MIQRYDNEQRVTLQMEATSLSWQERFPNASREFTGKVAATALKYEPASYLQPLAAA